jgi:hypothetical protein
MTFETPQQSMSSLPAKPLIRSYERISFVVVFIFATVCGRFLANGILSQSIFDTLSETNGILYSLVSGCLLGGFVGALQWLVLRKYVPDKLWIVAMWFGTILMSLISALMNAAYQALVPNPFSNLTVPPPSGTTMALLTIAGLIANLSGLYLFGYLQLRVLRSYVVDANWWSFWPIAAVVLRTLHVFPVLFFSAIIPRIQSQAMPNMLAIAIASPFASGLLIFPLLAATQAIAFCFLNRKPPTIDAGTNDDLVAPWLQTPELASYWRTLALYVPLYRKITRSWKSDLTVDQRLSYRIGVNAQGEIIGYEPNAPMASEYVEQTPLPALVGSAPTDVAGPLARFNVTFAPPAEIYLSPLRQISRRRLMITTYLMIVVMVLVSQLILRSLPTKFGDLVFRLFS